MALGLNCSELLFKLETKEFEIDEYLKKLNENYSNFNLKFSLCTIDSKYDCNINSLINVNLKFKNMFIDTYKKRMLMYQHIIKEYKKLIFKTGSDIEREMFISLRNEYKNKLMNTYYLLKQMEEYQIDFKSIKKYKSIKRSFSVMDIENKNNQNLIQP